MTWRKGCLCGCLIEEECRYYEPPIQRHHHIIHIVRDAPVEFIDADAVEVIRAVES